MSDCGTRVLLIRHPETLANAEGRYAGRTDSPLTETGAAQTRALAAEMDRWKPVMVFSSPLARALECARAIAPADVAVSVLADLAEIDFGVAEGMTYAELRAAGIVPDYAGIGPIAPGGEDAAAFDGRVRRAAELLERCGPRVAVVTHGGVVRRLITRWLELPLPAAWRFDLPNACVVEIRLTDGVGVLERLDPSFSTRESRP